MLLCGIIKDMVVSYSGPENFYRIRDAINSMPSADVLSYKERIEYLVLLGFEEEYLNEYAKKAKKLKYISFLNDIPEPKEQIDTIKNEGMKIRIATERYEIQRDQRFDFADRKFKEYLEEYGFNVPDRQKVFNLESNYCSMAYSFEDRIRNLMREPNVKPNPIIIKVMARGFEDEK